MKNIRMMKNRLRLFCFYRKCLSLFLLFILNHFFYANTSDIDGILTKRDGALITIENGALLYVEQESTTQEESTKIYVIGCTTVKNISEITNAEVVYIEKKSNLSRNDAKIKKKNTNSTKKNIKIVQQKSRIKSYTASSSSSTVLQSFGENGRQFTVPSQNSSKTKAILNEKIAIVIDDNYSNANLFSFNNSDCFASFNSDFSVRPPPTSKE